LTCLLSRPNKLFNENIISKDHGILGIPGDGSGVKDDSRLETSCKCLLFKNHLHH